MASAEATNDSEDFITCSVCLCEYDYETRRPKFLSCAHSLCLSCLEGIHSNGSVVCPLCRNIVPITGSVSGLPNNGFALHILKLRLNSNKEVITKKVAKPPKCMWCLTCGALAKSECNDCSHSCIDMSTVSLKNFESLLTLRHDLHQKIEEGQTKLAEAIEKRREVQDYLSQVSKALKLFSSEVDGLEEENNLLLTELVSLLEGPTDENEPCLSELVTLLEDCSGDDTIESLREKLSSEYRPKYEDKLTLTNARAAELEEQKKTKILVSLLDEANNPFLVMEGFKTDWPVNESMTSDQRNLLLLSHVIFSINNKHSLKGQAENKHIRSSVTSSSTQQFQTLSSAKTRTYSNSSSSSKSSVNQVTQQKPQATGSQQNIPQRRTQNFTFYIFKSKQPFGQLCIEPVASSPCLDFIWRLTNWCKTNSLDSLSVGTTIPGVFMLVACIVPPLLSLPLTSSFTALPYSPSNVNKHTANRLGDVGVTLITTSGNRVTSFSLIFPLDKFQDPGNAVHLKGIPPAFLLGSITNSMGSDSVHKLVSATKNNEPSDFRLLLRCLTDSY